MSPRIRPAAAVDRDAIDGVVRAAFGQPDEAILVRQLVADGDALLELVAEDDGVVVGHVLYSRLAVDTAHGRFDAVALAPVAVLPAWQGKGLGSALIRHGDATLDDAGERLTIVLGDAGFYGRLGYMRDAAAGFETPYQGDHLLALSRKGAPQSGRLVYPRAFGEL